MPTLDKKGYIISINGWMGNFGNHLRQLSGAINVAQKTHSRLSIPDHPLLKRKVYDFLNRQNVNCLGELSGRFFFNSECFQFPLNHDYDRRKIFQAYIYNQLVTTTAWERLQNLLRWEPDDQVGSDTLVINIRSGSDIFCAHPAPDARNYIQPPLSFYKKIIQSHNFRDVLIVTQSDRANPCVSALLSWDQRIRVKTHANARDDFRTLLCATHLVTCHSTFSWSAALMSRKLQTLFQPDSCVIRGVRDYSVHTYTLLNYIQPGDWVNSPEQRDLMLHHSEKDIEVVYKQRLPNGGRDESEYSRCS